MGERDDGSWAAFECAHIMSRQGGKGSELELRQLAGLFVLDEELQLHTAHEFKTANEHFLRMANLVDNSPDLRRKVARIRYASGEQGIELKSGARLKFMARSGGSGRGFAGASTVYLDEAMYLTAAMLGAILPTLSTHWNPQVIYTGSGGFAASDQLWSLRRRALSGDGGRLAYLEHTAEQVSLVDGVVRSNGAEVDPADRKLWWLANPAMRAGRISEEAVEAQFRAMPRGEFLRERLGVWEPELVANVKRVISEADWLAPENVVTDEFPVAPESFGVALSADGRTAAVAWCGVRDGVPMVGVLDYRPAAGTSWLEGVVAEVRARKPGAPVAVNPRSEVRGVLDQLGEVVEVNAAEWAGACAALKAAVLEHRVRYRRQSVLEDALRLGAARPLAGGWAWQAPPGGEVVAVEAVTLALHAHRVPASVSVAAGWFDPWGDDG